MIWRRPRALLQPLDTLWENEPWSDLFPLPPSDRPEGRALAVPYELDLRLLADDSDIMAPNAAGRVARRRGLAGAVPAAPGEPGAPLPMRCSCNMLRWGSDAGARPLDEGALAAALEYYRVRHEQEQFHTAVLTATNLLECWELFAAGQADATEATAHLVSGGRASAPRSELRAHRDRERDAGHDRRGLGLGRRHGRRLSKAGGAGPDLLAHGKRNPRRARRRIRLSAGTAGSPSDGAE